MPPAPELSPASLAAPAFDLSGRRALVTGGSRGIGAAIARHLAACGARVAVNYVSSRDTAEALVAALPSNTNGPHLALAGDVSDPAAVDALFARLDDAFGGLDILINNAGWESVGHAIDLPLEDFDRALGVNLRGPFLCSQRAARLMARGARGGVIVNNLSIHDQVPRKGLAPYCAAKAGALMLTRCLALEFAEYGIRVNAVSPGAIETDMNRAEIERFGRERFERTIPLGRVGSVDDIAGVVSFLCSNHAAYITGTTLYADGGYMLTTVPYDPRPPRGVVAPAH